ncbi:MAG: hypothetical protein K2N88_04490 [Muribaculaceae bacterium]|nr:hypothetical protein [Muribaculaceae bacterium]
MESNDREIRREEERATDAARANHKVRKDNNTRRTNKLWLWLGVLVLIFILLYWLFSIGMFEDLAGTING